MRAYSNVRRECLTIAVKTASRGDEWIILHDGWCAASKVKPYVEWLKTATAFMDKAGHSISEPAQIVGVFGSAAESTFNNPPVILWER